MPVTINLTADRLHSLDPGNMLGMTLELPQQIERGLELGREFARSHDLPKLDEVDWMGLGGSAVAGDLLQAFGYEPPALPLRMRVVRSPRPTKAARLVCSYSGNTVEALHAFEEVPRERIWFSMSSGGKLRDMARNAKVPHLTLPSGYPPRAAVGFTLGAMTAIFEEVYRVKPAELPDVLTRLNEDAPRYRILNQASNPALELAVTLVNRTPVIYAVDALTMPAVASRFRAQLAENSKVWSHAFELPEMAHNEVESFSHLSQLLPPPLVIFLGCHSRDSRTADPRPGLRTLSDDFRIGHTTLDPSQIWGAELSRLEAGLRTMLLLDAATVFLAVLRAVDPLEIPIITRLKNISAGH
jgi:glucose/mannose-6-phosphate isomerase